MKPRDWLAMVNLKDTVLIHEAQKYLKLIQLPGAAVPVQLLCFHLVVSSLGFIKILRPANTLIEEMGRG